MMKEVYILPLEEEEVPALSPVSDTSQSTIESSSTIEDIIHDMGSGSVCVEDQAPQNIVSIQRTLPSHDSTSDIESSGRSRCVSFGQVEMKEYPMILGDHPDTEDGPPVRL
jgi:hypothetical protein